MVCWTRNDTTPHSCCVGPEAEIQSQLKGNECKINEKVSKLLNRKETLIYNNQSKKKKKKQAKSNRVKMMLT